ncbi:MAG: response regulator [Coxiellaceae bacterium]|nr:response regulator [Coxiellaceae bacterium]
MLKWINNYIAGKLSETGAQYKAYGIFGFLNFPFYYIVWLYLSPESYESLALRVVCTLLCCFLIFYEKWPLRLKPYLPLYWYITLVFTLPFFFTFMLIMNHGSEMWMTNTILIVFFMLMLVDWLTAIFLLFIGSLGGIVAASFFTSKFFPESFNYLGFFITYIVAILIGMIFAHNKEIIEKIMRRSIKAEANSKAKSEFIANMSHDLRTPITGILGLVQDMLNAAQQAEASLHKKRISKHSVILRDIIDTVRRDGDCLMVATGELLDLCNEILEVVRVESGKDDASKESFDIHSLIKHNIAMFQPVACHKNLKLVYAADRSIPLYLNGIRIYLDRVMLNLISNALKFTDNGSVNITTKMVSSVSGNVLACSGDVVTVKVMVEDTGIGIPHDKLDVIFHHFSRLSPSFEGTYKGSGLGLYTVKRYIEAMRGSIDVVSQVGKGSCFTLTLPFGIPDCVHVDGDVMQPQNFVNPHTQNKLAEKQRSEDKEVVDVSILLVEDHKLAAFAVTAVLRPYNCFIEIAENGAMAVKMAEERSYDLILMDIGLPDFSGIEVTRRIRAFSDVMKSQVPIIALTGHADNAEMRQDAIDAGMQEILSKPAQIDILKSVLERYACSKITK